MDMRACKQAGVWEVNVMRRWVRCIIWSRRNSALHDRQVSRLIASMIFSAHVIDLACDGVRGLVYCFVLPSLCTFDAQELGSFIL